MNVKKSLLAAVALFGSIGVAGPILVQVGPTISVSPGATFFQQNANDDCTFASRSPQCTGPSFFSPSFIDLGGLGLVAGEQLFINVSGLLCIMPSSTGCGTPNLAAIFSSTNVYDTTVSDTLRVPGAVS